MYFGESFSSGRLNSASNNSGGYWPNSFGRQSREQRLTQDFESFPGQQQNWPTSPGTFVNNTYVVPTYFGYPPSLDPTT
jgi:hypothetical protein